MDDTFDGVVTTIEMTRIRGTLEQINASKKLAVLLMPVGSGVPGAIQRLGELTTNSGIIRPRVFGWKFDINITLSWGVEVGPLYVNDDRSNFHTVSAPICGICQEESGSFNVGGRGENGFNPGSPVLLRHPT